MSRCMLRLRNSMVSIMEVTMARKTLLMSLAAVTQTLTLKMRLPCKGQVALLATQCSHQSLMS